MVKELKCIDFDVIEDMCFFAVNKWKMEERKMKICPNCRNPIGDRANYCDKCGTRLTVSQKQSKKQNTGVIIGIVIVVVSILAIIGSVAEEVFQQQGYIVP